MCQIEITLLWCRFHRIDQTCIVLWTVFLETTVKRDIDFTCFYFSGLHGLIINMQINFSRVTIRVTSMVEEVEDL